MKYLALLLICNPIPYLLELNQTVHEIMQRTTTEAAECTNEKCLQDWEKTMALLEQIERAASDRILRECPMEERKGEE